MHKGTVISLCDLTGIMVQPWVDAGYRAVLVDPQHQVTASEGEGQIEKLACTILEAMPLPNQSTSSGAMAMRGVALRATA